MIQILVLGGKSLDDLSPLNNYSN